MTLIFLELRRSPMKEIYIVQVTCRRCIGPAILDFHLRHDRIATSLHGYLILRTLFPPLTLRAFAKQLVATSARNLVHPSCPLQQIVKPFNIEAIIIATVPTLCRSIVYQISIWENRPLIWLCALCIVCRLYQRMQSWLRCKNWNLVVGQRLCCLSRDNSTLLHTVPLP